MRPIARLGRFGMGLAWDGRMAHIAQPRDGHRPFIVGLLEDEAPGETVITSSTPSLPLVMLIGGSLVLAVTILLLNRPEAPAGSVPLDGAVQGERVAAVPGAVAVPATGAADLSVIVPSTVGEQPMQMGPALPPEGRVALTMTVPQAGQSAIVVEHAWLGDDGSLRQAEPLTLAVMADSDGRAAVEIPVAALAHDQGPGLYQIRMVWNGQVIGQTDAAVSLHQPSGVAILAEPHKVTFEAGEYTGRKFNAQGRIAGEKAFALGNPSGADAMAYGVFNGQPHALILNGVWAGYWIPLAEGVQLR